MTKQKTPVLMVGMPGDLATKVAEGFQASADFELVGMRICGRDCKVALTGEKTKDRVIDDAFVEEYVNRTGIYLAKPSVHEATIATAKSMHPDLIAINCADKGGFPVNFILMQYDTPTIFAGTGVSAEEQSRLAEIVKNSRTLYMRSTNMAMFAVSLMDFTERYAQEHKGALKDCSLAITESHQSTKKDTSGTAKAMLKYFRTLGIQMDEKLVDALNKFKMEKPEDVTFDLGYGSKFSMKRLQESQAALSVPHEHLGGHGWHRYTLNPLISGRTEEIQKFAEAFKSVFLKDSNPALKNYRFQRGAWENSATSPDGNVYVGIINLENGGLILDHNINGRGVYVDGAVNHLAPFLVNARDRGEKGKVYSAMNTFTAA